MRLDQKKKYNKYLILKYLFEFLNEILDRFKQ